MNYSPHMSDPTFSQVHGLQEVPGPPTLEHISDESAELPLECPLDAPAAYRSAS